MGNDLEQKFDVNAFLKHLQRYLLIHSEDVENLCYICGDDMTEVNAEWVDCDICHRWFHLNCLSNESSYKRLSEKSQNEEIGSHCCKLCKANNFKAKPKPKINMTDTEIEERTQVKVVIKRPLKDIVSEEDKLAGLGTSNKKRRYN